MGGWVLQAFGVLGVGYAVLYFASKALLLADLLRHWSTVRELWGMDWLDIVYRINRTFDVSICAADFAGWTREAKYSLTVGQLWHLVTAKLRNAGRAMPEDGWQRLVAAVCEALNVKPAQVTPNAQLFRDLDMQWGLD